jgi:hypothetical protein
MCRGTRWPISACSASKSSDGFMGISFRNEGDAEGGLRLRQAREAIRMVGSARRTDVASTLKA